MSTLAETKLEVCKCGGIPIIVGALYSHSGNAAIVEVTCQTLYSLALSTANQAVIGRSGAIPLPTQALKDHSAEPYRRRKVCLCSGKHRGKCRQQNRDYSRWRTQLLLALAMRVVGSPAASAAKQALQKLVQTSAQILFKFS